MEPTEIRYLRVMYELGRLRRSGRMTLVVLPMLGWALFTGRPASLVVPAGVLLLLVAAAATFVHLRQERAVLAGLAAGFPALLLPWAMNSLGLVRIGGTSFDPCVPSCVLAGAIAGAFVALRAARERRHWSFWLTAAAVANALGVLGCSIAGGAGLLGLAIGVVAGTAPVIVRTELSR